MDNSLQQETTTWRSPKQTRIIAINYRYGGGIFTTATISLGAVSFQIRIVNVQKDL